MVTQWLEFQNQRTSTKWIFRELLGSEDVYELFINPIKIYPPQVSTLLPLDVNTM